MLLVLLSCVRSYDGLPIVTSPAIQPVLADFVGFIGDSRLELLAVDHMGPVQNAQGMSIAVLEDPSCTECFRVVRQGEDYTVYGGMPLGVQYGLASLLEDLGYRFWHPNATYLPATLAPVEVDSTPQAPKMKRRGIHLHTLHPIEGLEAMWHQEDPTRGRHIMDWVIKNGGNHLQWVALDDIINDSGRRAAWQTVTRDHLSYAHARGLTAGLGIQLFGSGNLQLAFDLVDSPGIDEASQIRDRLQMITEDLPWDVLNLSFGEFSGAEPEKFIASTNLAYAEMQAQLPGVDVPATIHVGNFEDLRVTYQGQELLYYFLVQFADPGIRPWIHTVMYYNLFDDAGGAYLHEEFDEHRAFLLDHLQADKPIGYFPESAYWVAFDNPVPLYLPLYLKSRHVDFAEIEAAAPGKLQDHVLFSSGWEWGYWQQDVATLRYAWGKDAAWDDSLRFYFSPLGEPGAQTAAAAAALGELQYEALIGKRLAAWLAGRDAVMDIGDSAGILSQPRRPTIDEMLAFTPEQRAAFEVEVLIPLAQHAADVRALALPELTDDLDPTARRAMAEVADGIAVDASRASFAVSLWSSVMLAAAGEDPSNAIAAAEAELEVARGIVARRHADFHDPNPLWTAESWDNATIYDYGYLAQSHQLCFWERERVQVRNKLLGESGSIPTCVL